MKRQRTFALLSQSKPELQVRFGVTRLALFGSTIRDTAGSDSNVDIRLPSMDRPPHSATSGCNFIWKIYWVVRWIWSPRRHCP